MQVKFRGKQYPLRQRSDKPDSPYVVRATHQGKQVRLSTKTADASMAKVRAKELLEELFDGERKSPTAPIRTTVADVLAAFREKDRAIKARTVIDAERCLLLMLRDTLGIDNETARQQPLTVLTADFARQYQVVKQGSHSVDYATPRQQNTGINSIFRQAKQVFSKKALAEYRRIGLPIPPCISEFMAVTFLREPSHRYSDNPIPKAQIDAMNEALPALKEQDERLWAIHLMIRLMGLRASEIVQARQSWLVPRGDSSVSLVIVARDGSAPKRQGGEVSVPAVLRDWFAAREYRADDKERYLIPATSATDRYNLVYKIHSRWVRQFIPGRTKTNHELRKHAGSVVATKTNSFERAAEFLRVDIETAKIHYLAFVSRGESLDLGDL